jgi:hypothetical protein
MLEKRRMLMDAETDRCNQLASDFLILAEKELSAFIRAVDQLFGAEQARQSALDWIERHALRNSNSARVASAA